MKLRKHKLQVKNFVDDFTFKNMWMKIENRKILHEKANIIIEIMGESFDHLFDLVKFSVGKSIREHINETGKSNKA